MKRGRDLRALLQLRRKLLVRFALSRFTPEARRAAPFRLLAVLVFGLTGLLILSGAVSLLFVYVFPQATAQALIPAALLWSPSAAMLGMFFYSILTLAARFTYRSDLSILLLTPLSPRLILAEKLFALSGAFSLVLLAVSTPSLTGTGFVLHAGRPFVLAAALVLLLLPIAPVSLAMLLVIFSLRWLPPARARLATAIIGMVVAGAAYVGIGAMGDRPVHLPLGSWSLLPTTWPGHALLAAAHGQQASACVYLFASALLAAGSAALAIDRSAHLLTIGWATYHEVGRRNCRRSEDLLPAWLRASVVVSIWRGVRPVWWPMVRKEWLTFRRDPKLLAQLLYPLLIEGYSFYHSFGLPASAHAALRGRVQETVAGGLFITASFTAVFLLSLLTLPSISREGSSLYLLGLVPVRARDLLLAKWIFTVVPVLMLSELLLVGVGAPLLRLSPQDTIFNAAVMAYLTIALGGVLLCVGLIWPRLSSDNSRRQVHGMALLVGPVSGITLCATVGGLLSAVYMPNPEQPWNPPVAGIAIFVVTGVLIAGVLALGPRLLHDLIVGDRRPA